MTDAIGSIAIYSQQLLNSVMKMTEHRQESHQVTLESGESITYEIRGLKEEEIEKWAAFCASIFSYKANPPPPSYFERHYRNDPDRVASLIRVAIAPGGNIVASCRLFLRTLSGGLNSGGIGEVCTANDHRRRGLSKVLLTNVIEIMKERTLQVSLLHAAPAFFPVYESVGYSCSASKWSVVPVVLSKLKEDQIPDGFKVREASFPGDIEQLSQLHKKFSEDRFAGCIVRSPEYWNEYLSVELNDSLWVFEGSHGIAAWLSIRPRGDRFQLREFGYNNELPGGPAFGVAFASLLSHAIQNILNTSEEECMLALPTFVLEDCKSESLSGIEFEQATSDDDLGWMYKILDSSISIEDVNGKNRPHLIWPADSF
mmetsp:Transcript_37170/g.107077  ORF Transcript_37170/g.107077 Transcript_37170/m.107077 type:complete len:371 (+) Transcript_37170:49-1161(+)